MLTDFKKSQYIRSTIPALKAQNLPKLLAQIDQESCNNKAVYNDEDIQIKGLIEIKKDIYKSN